jgi:hypothetical protein
MFRKRETRPARNYFWNDVSTAIEAIQIQLTDKSILSAGMDSDEKNMPYPAASYVIIRRNIENGDILLDYMKGDTLYAEEIVYGHTISRVDVKFSRNE